MTHPYIKFDPLLGRDLTAAERLEPARTTLRFSIKLLEQFIRTTEKASDRLTDEQLEIICKACDQALHAAENCAFMGDSGFNARPLEKIEWKD